MPQPTLSSVHVNRPLTNISVAYLQSLADFIADKVFPIVPVAKQSDRYFKYDKDNWFRTEARERAPATESAGSGFTIDNTPSYYCPVIAVHKDVDDQVRANSDEPINPDRDATLFVTHQIALKREKDFAARYFTTGVWTGSSTGTDIVAGTKWDATGSDPVDDVEEQRDAVRVKTGLKPNIAVATPTVHRALKNNASIIDRIKYTERGVVTEDLLASLFGVDKYMVAEGSQNTAAEGQTASMSNIYGTEGLMLVYAAPSPSLQLPSGGYTFAWTGFLGSSQGWRIKKFRMDILSADRVEGEASYDQKIVAPDVGVFFSDVLT